MELAASRIRQAVRRSMRLRTPDKPQQGAYHVDFPSMLARIGCVARHADRKSPILLVGDDDLTSVCLHMLGFSDITLLDFDEELLAIAERASRGKIRAVCFDLRGVYSGKLPRLGARHRLFLTDPPYGRDGLRVFAGVGMRALAPGGTAMVVCPTHRAENSSVGDPLELGHLLQTFLLASGATMIDLLADSQRSYHGTVSSLLVAQKSKRRARVDFSALAGPRWFY
jgi:predicted methyltransferase